MDKVVLVTGGGRGIGAATSILLGQQGYLVCVNYRKDRISAERIVSEIQAQGGEALAVQADVAVEEQVTAMFDLIANTFGHVTHLVNNAGILLLNQNYLTLVLSALSEYYKLTSLAAFML